MNFICCLFFLTIFVCEYLFCSSEDNFKLELLQVLFRHGDRTPDKKETYKTDPYNSIYQKIGYGELTKIGMQRSYRMGEILRQRYGSFLGKYRTENVYARSTDIDRTKMSLQLALTGLYPPTNETLWNKNIFWSPIPTHYEPTDIDFLYTFFKCPSFLKIRNKYIHEALQNANISQSYKDNIVNNTGLALSDGLLFGIENNIESVLSLGLPLPGWFSEEDYKETRRIQAIIYKSFTKNKLIAKISAGLVVQEFLKNIKNHENGKGANKIYLYSAHDVNVATFRDVHNFTGVPSYPNYGSAVIVEKLRGYNNEVYLRVFFWTGASEQWVPLKFSNYNYEIPLSEYIKRMEWTLPDNSSKMCTSTPSFCQKS